MSAPGFRSETARLRAHYAHIRQCVHEAATPAIRSYADSARFETVLTEISDEALDAWELQWSPKRSEPIGGWNWRNVCDHFRRRHKKRFEVAIWAREKNPCDPNSNPAMTLCGLAIGKPSDRHNNLSVYVLESSPVRGHPLGGKILVIALDTAKAHALALNCKELRLIKPLSSMMPKYEALGFKLQNSNKRIAPYCVREVGS